MAYGVAAALLLCHSTSVMALVMQLPQRESDLLVWLCRLMASVVEREADNRMGPKVARA